MLQCTPEGIRLQCYMKYYTEEMKTSWFHKYSRFALIRESYKCTLIPAVNRVQFNWVHRANIIPDHNISHGCRWPCFRIVVLSLVFRVLGKVKSPLRRGWGSEARPKWPGCRSVSLLIGRRASTPLRFTMAKLPTPDPLTSLDKASHALLIEWLKMPMYAYLNAYMGFIPISSV